MVRPVELQDAFGKTPAVEKIVQSQKANPENEQKAALVTSEKKSQETQHKAAPTPHSDEVILHKDKPDEEKKQSAKDKTEDEVTDEGEDAETAGSDGDQEKLPPPSLDITV